MELSLNLSLRGKTYIMAWVATSTQEEEDVEVVEMEAITSLANPQTRRVGFVPREEPDEDDDPDDEEEDE